MYWAPACSLLCSYWFSIGVFPCSTCHSVIWGKPGSSLGVGLSNDKQLLITNQQWDKTPPPFQRLFHRDGWLQKWVVLIEPQEVCIHIYISHLVKHVKIKRRGNNQNVQFIASMLKTTRFTQVLNTFLFSYIFAVFMCSYSSLIYIFYVTQIILAVLS